MPITPSKKRHKVCSVLPAVASAGWETRRNTLTLSAGGVVESAQIAVETHRTPVARTSGEEKFNTMAAILQDAAEGKKFMGFFTSPVQTERFDSDPEQDEEDFYPAIVPPLWMEVVSVNCFALCFPAHYWNNTLRRALYRSNTLHA